MFKTNLKTYLLKMCYDETSCRNALLCKIIFFRRAINDSFIIIIMIIIIIITCKQVEGLTLFVNPLVLYHVGLADCQDFTGLPSILDTCRYKNGINTGHACVRYFQFPLHYLLDVTCGPNGT